MIWFNYSLNNYMYCSWMTLWPLETKAVGTGRFKNHPNLFHTENVIMSPLIPTIYVHVKSKIWFDLIISIVSYWFFDWLLFCGDWGCRRWMDISWQFKSNIVIFLSFSHLDILLNMRPCNWCRRLIQLGFGKTWDHNDLRR